MKDIFEEYGDFILQLLGGFSALGILFSLLAENGALNKALGSVFGTLT